MKLTFSLGSSTGPTILHRKAISIKPAKLQVRERELTETSLLSDGGIRFWILYESDSPTPLCACETFNRKKGLVKAPGCELREVPVIGVASVFTSAQNRGKGYAGLLMRLLANKIRELTGNRGFSVLYSDVGPIFYAKNGGWETYDADTLVVPSDKVFPRETAVELLTLESAHEWIGKDVKALRDEFSGEEGQTLIQMIPQQSELEWATVRDHHSAQFLNLEISEFVGARVFDEKGWGYILWFHQWKESSLTVLRLREPRSNPALVGLIEAALSEARRSKMQKLTIWSPSNRLEKVVGIQKTQRKSALPGLLYMGDETPVKWRSIEKISWC